MQDFISVRVLSLRELFSGEFQFRLPWFQRAYAWLPGEVARLLADILEAMDGEADKRRYFLGNIMLAKESAASDTALVDGHQRVMTLTILFAVLRDLATDTGEKKRLDEMISGSGYRLEPQDALREFVKRYVQEPGATAREIEEAVEDLSETERNIVDNREYLLTALGLNDPGEGQRRQIADFLLDKCFVSVSIVRDEDEAWHFLQIEEDTRHRFNLANRAKASLLAIVPPGQREACRKIWDRSEQMLGTEDMFALLGHVRALKLRKLTEKPVDAELAQIARFNREALSFMETELEPCARRLMAIRRKEAGPIGQQAEIGSAIERATWVSPNVWIPAGMRWLETRSDCSEGAHFFNRLERLVWLLRLAGIDPARQQRHFFRVLAEIDKGLPVEEMKELAVTKKLRADVLQSLRAPTFDSRRYASKLLRRIAIAQGEDPGPIDPDRCTIEHILPSGWLDKSDWRREFKTPKSVKAWAHRLGNLTFLTGPENLAADSLDYADKKPIYARGTYAISRELAATGDWTASAIEQRTERLIQTLFKAWDIPY